MARQNIDGTDFIGGNGLTKLNDNFTELYASQPPLAEDAHAQAAALSTYPQGSSIMPVSATANWFGYGLPGVVTTHRTGSEGWQTIAWGDGNVFWSFRHWDSTVTAWEVVQEPLVSGSIYTDIVKNVRLLTQDLNAESAAITDYPGGISIMPTSSGANWGPNSGEAGMVTTARNASDGTQTFHAYNNNQYRRAYTSSAWSSWVAT